MKKILIFTGSQNYGASVSSSSADTAITPDILNAGAVGIYALVGTDADTVGNNNKSCLVIGSSGTGAAGAIKASVLVTGGGDLLRFIQGQTDYPVWIGDIQRSGVRRFIKQAYSAPIKQVTFIGYNGSTGSMNMSTVAQNDEGIILGLQAEASTDDKIREQENYTTGRLDALAATYDVLAKVANNINTRVAKTNSAFVTADGTLADFTGTATAILFTKGSTTARFMIQGATGWTASTGSVTTADIIGIAPFNMESVTFTANILGTAAGHHIITIGATQYVVADAGTAAQNATAIAAAINAGSQATATTSGTSDVTVVLNRANYSQKILVTYSADDSSWTILTLTVNTTSGESVPVRYKASATVSAAATFELDYAYQGETGYFLGGTTGSLHTGIVTSSTVYGLKLIVDTAGVVYNYAIQGVFQNATVPTVSVGSSLGSGSGDRIVALEEKYVVVRGQLDSVDKRMKTLPRFAVASTNYDIYTIQYANRTTQSGFHHDKSDESTVMLAFPAGGAQATEFENIVKTTGLFSGAAFNF